MDPEEMRAAFPTIPTIVEWGEKPYTAELWEHARYLIRKGTPVDKVVELTRMGIKMALKIAAPIIAAIERAGDKDALPVKRAKGTADEISSPDLDRYIRIKIGASL